MMSPRKRMIIAFMVQTQTLLRVKGDTIKNYARMASINQNCPVSTMIVLGKYLKVKQRK